MDDACVQKNNPANVWVTSPDICLRLFSEKCSLGQCSQCAFCVGFIPYSMMVQVLTRGRLGSAGCFDVAARHSEYKYFNFSKNVCKGVVSKTSFILILKKASLVCSIDLHRQPKHWLGHPGNYVFSLSKKLFSGSKYPKNNLFYFEKGSTGCNCVALVNTGTLIFCILFF